MKACKRCFRDLPLSEFMPHKRSADKMGYHCRDCDRLGKYGMTYLDFEAMWAAQGYGCAICGRDDNPDDKGFAVDHDRRCCPRIGSCGECVRGLLCCNCNRGIGLFDDNPIKLQAAQDYLENWRNT